MDTGVVYLYYYESSAYKWEILLHSFYENGEYESLLKETLENVYPKAVARFNEKWDGAK